MLYEPDPLPSDFADAVADGDGRFGRFGSPLLYFATVGSTNDVASQLAETGHREGAVVVADQQTAGRGRRGRTWFSPPRAGLYVSVVIDPSAARAAADRANALLTLAAGVALAEGIQTATGLAPAIKWPNDLVVGRRKLAGILAEAVSGAVVLGYGINVAPAAYPPELADRATSLESELGRAVDRARLWAETLTALSRRVDDLLAGRFDAILDAWRGRAPGSRGAEVRWDTPRGPRSGITAGIDDLGALLVRVGQAETDGPGAPRLERLVAGEVNWA